jgi:hypothetical protein
MAGGTATMHERHDLDVLVRMERAEKDALRARLAFLERRLEALEGMLEKRGSRDAALEERLGVLEWKTAQA